MKKRRVRISFGNVWSAVSSLLIAGLGIALILFAGLSTHIEGYSQAEIESAHASRSLGAIIENPVNAPHKLTTWAFGHVTDDLVIAARVASATFGAAAIMVFYVATRMWHGKRIAFLVSILFGTSSWFLLTARSGVPDISASLAIIALALSGYWMSLHYRTLWSYIAAIFALTLMVFVPGMLWLIAAGLLIRGVRDIKSVIQSLPRWNFWALIGLLSVLVVLPIAIAVVRDPQVALALLGLPTDWPSLAQLWSNVSHGMSALIVWHAQILPIAIGSLPVIDVVTAAFGLMGIYYYWRRRALDRAKLIGAVLGLGTIFVALGSAEVGYALLLPISFLLTGGGLALLLGRWLEVFPRNPLARTIGISCLAVLVGFACFYNLRSYFIAAPYTQNIKQIYRYDASDLVQ